MTAMTNLRYLQQDPRTSKNATIKLSLSQRETTFVVRYITSAMATDMAVYLDKLRERIRSSAFSLAQGSYFSISLTF